MKTFSKVLSMILVGVMCFGLFAGSAFASEFVFSDDGDPVVAESATFGDSSTSGSFTFDEGNSSGSDFALPSVPAQNGDFTLNAEEQPAQTETQTETKTEADTAFTFEKDGVKLEDQDTFEKRWIKEDSDKYEWTWYLKGAKIGTSGVVYSKYSGDAVALKAEKSGGLAVMPDTFDGYAYTRLGNYSDATTISESNLIKGTDSVQFKNSWLDSLPTGTYYIWGLPSLDAPQYLGYLQINGANQALYLSNRTYTKQMKTPYDLSLRVAITGSINSMADFGVVPVGSSGGQTVGALNYTNDGSAVYFSIEFLNSLPAGEYYVVGFPNASNYSEQVRADKTMVIKDYVDPGTGWSLVSYQYGPWTSGDDYLRFYSNLMETRKYYPNTHVILRYGVGASSSPNRQVDVNQYWDYEDGNFALGSNFLNSLSAGTYTLQVVDVKNNRSTNIVTFSIGAKLIPIDSDKHVINSIRNLRFLCDDRISQVYVGNIPLTYGEDYALSADRKTVTLSYEFLNKRSAGNTYTIKVQTDGGYYCSSTFQILTTAQGGASPRTGDESNLGLWAAFLLISGSAVVVLIPKLRKHGM